MMMMIFCRGCTVVAAVVAVSCWIGAAFHPVQSLAPSSSSRNVVTLGRASAKATTISSRRDIFRQVALIAASGAVVGGATPQPALAAASAANNTPSRQELERLQKGHARVQYLLDHWDDVTKVCGRTISKYLHDA